MKKFQVQDPHGSAGKGGERGEGRRGKRGEGKEKRGGIVLLKTDAKTRK
jgi:hypothetical protein